MVWDVAIVKTELLRQLNFKYKGEMKVKTFGYLSQFEVMVTEIWCLETDRYQARVDYKDGDKEDIPLEELRWLLAQRRARGHMNGHGLIAEKPLVIG